MLPRLLRNLRGMSTVLVFVLSFAVAAALAWGIRRRERPPEPAPTECARVLDQVFAGGASDTPDSVLLAQLMDHRDNCMRDPRFVDQVRRLMLNTQRVDD